MELIRPASLDEALAAKAAFPDALPIAGGTDVMVEINFGRMRPEAMIDLSHVAELSRWETRDGSVRVGAGMTYSRIATELSSLLPGLAQASRTIGSAQLRNRATIGGNLGSASPAGDVHPVLLASGASILLASVRGRREVRAADFYTGPKKNVLETGELVEAVVLPVPAGYQQFSKVGARNAMVIAACSLAVSIRPALSRVGTGIGSAGPTPLAATAAERFLEEAITGEGMWDGPRPMPAAMAERFASLVSQSSSPIDDLRATAAYRRHALHVMAMRCLQWCWDDYLGACGYLGEPGTAGPGAAGREGGEQRCA
ncbi:MAG: FAD binding domain-containing protein [Acidimicrobiales bacterium]